PTTRHACRTPASGRQCVRRARPPDAWPRNRERAHLAAHFREPDTSPPSTRCQRYSGTAVVRSLRILLGFFSISFNFRAASACSREFICEAYFREVLANDGAAKIVRASIPLFGTHHDALSNSHSHCVRCWIVRGFDPHSRLGPLAEGTFRRGRFNS